MLSCEQAVIELGHRRAPRNQVFDDDESALGSDSSSQSASITSSILNYKYENGRRYHAYREGEYMLPNDELEQDRLDLHHHVFRLTLGGRLFRAPIVAYPQRVLNFGTGTGIWAMDFADAFPSAEVIGTDLSPIQPSWVPPSCKFYVDDVESDWTYSPDEAFDFVHGRGMGGSIRDWSHLYSQAHEHLKPGGWIEMQEYEAWIRSDDDTIDNAPSVKQWQELCDEASTKFGKKLNVAEAHKQRLIDAGFVDVRDDVYKVCSNLPYPAADTHIRLQVPIGTWPRDPKLKELGKYQLEQMCDCVEPFTLALLTRILKWRNEECQVLMAGVTRDFRSRRNHLYVNFHFAYGRKPD